MSRSCSLLNGRHTHFIHFTIYQLSVTTTQPENLHERSNGNDTKAQAEDLRAILDIGYDVGVITIGVQ